MDHHIEEHAKAIELGWTAAGLCLEVDRPDRAVAHAEGIKQNMKCKEELKTGNVSNLINCKTIAEQTTKDAKEDIRGAEKIKAREAPQKRGHTKIKK